MTTKALYAGLVAGLALATPAAAQYAGGGVKIGVSHDMSGAYSDLAGKGSVEAARLAIEDFGKPINGKPVEMVSADHQNKADIASSTARAWYDTQDVGRHLRHQRSVAALAVREVSKEKGKVDITIPVPPPWRSQQGLLAHRPALDL